MSNPSTQYKDITLTSPNAARTNNNQPPATSKSKLANPAFLTHAVFHGIEALDVEFPSKHLRPEAYAEFNEKVNAASKLAMAKMCHAENPVQLPVIVMAAESGIQILDDMHTEKKLVSSSLMSNVMSILSSRVTGDEHEKSPFLGYVVRNHKEGSVDRIACICLKFPDHEKMTLAKQRISVLFQTAFKNKLSTMDPIKAQRVLDQERAAILAKNGIVRPFRVVKYEGVDVRETLV